jgi:hemerythrin-like domain-containing protein
MSRPTHILKHEHRVIEKVLRALEGICWRLENDEPVPAEALSQVLDFINNYANRAHHAKEERYLFPLLQHCGIQDEAGPLGFLRAEHATERTLLQELEQAAAEWNGQGTATHFVTTALQFTRHLAAHIQQEDAILFSLTEELLDDPDKDNLLHSLIHPDGPDGADGHISESAAQHYEQLAEQLDAAWTI